MKLKRFLVSFALVAVAAVLGTVFSLRPIAATAVGGEGGRYVALGDSVAAGQGLPQGIGIPEEQVCGRSAQAYPYQIATATGMYLEHLACSGAKVDEGLYGPQQVGDNTLMPQLERAFAAGSPDLVTVTVGANDARWAQFVRKCYQWTCGSKWDDGLATVYLADLRWELYLALSQIAQLSGQDQPEVIFTGYFIPFSPDGPRCNEVRNFTTAEMSWMNTQAAKLNQVIHDAVSWYSFATYVPVDFSGHELCSNEPWVQGLQDLAPIHPTAGGQAAIARAITISR